MKSLITHTKRLLAVGILGLTLISAAYAQRPSRGTRSGGPSSPSVHSGRTAPSGRYGGTSYYGPSRRYYSRPYVSYPRFYGRVYSPYYHYYSPWLGVRLRVLPWGYLSFNFGPDLFYYYDGIFYRHNNDYYEVVTPPVGAEVPSLPAGASEIRINGQLYYEKNGVYYQEVTKDNNKRAYVVAGKDGELNTGNVPEPQEGDIVDNLPSDSRKVIINGLEYYLAPDGFYYQEIADGDKTAYKVVGSADDKR